MKRAIVVGVVALAACNAGGGDAGVGAAARSAPPSNYDLGRPVDSAALAAIDIDAGPASVLPAGRGTAATGAVVYAQKCAVCHGLKGEGSGVNPKLIGRDPRDGFPFGKDAKLAKTVGNYWPYATTVYDYVHRAMPLTTPGSLKPDEVYGVVAFLLAENEIIARDAEMNATSLPKVKMPAAGRFVKDDRAGKVVK